VDGGWVPTIGGPKATGPCCLALNWVSELRVMDYRNDIIVHEGQYLADPFEAPAWPKQRVQENA